MDNQEGKRVMPREGGPRGKKIALIAVIIILAALCAGYGGLCFYASSSDKLLPNTTAAGVSVGGMTRAEAETALSSALADRLSGLSVDFLCGDQTYTVPGSAFQADAARAVQTAADDQSSSLLTMGWNYITSLIAGKDYDVPVTLPETPQAVEEAVEASSDPDAQTTWERQGDNLVFTKGRTGRSVDTAALETDLAERAGHLLNDDEPAEYAPVEATVTTAPPADPDFDAIYQEIYTEPADAHLDAETKEIVDSVTGVSFDIAAAQALLERTEEGGTCTVPLILEEPNITTADLNEKLFADVLGQSSTRTAGPSNRWHNVDLACQRVNGTILLPGEVFSYNDLCGPYSQAGGYLKAGAYVSGTTQDTWAGGICQLSSTIYYTTLKANLETVERTKHKYDVGYLPSGMDATVYSNSLDFKFKNNTDYPIKIECALVKNSSGTRYCNVTIYGTNTTGIYGDPYSIVLSTISPQTKYEPNASVPEGSAPQKDPERTAYTGKKVEVHQRLRDANGNVISDTVIHVDTFSSRDAVYFYNPADAALWGIDPSTGLKTLTPVSPSPSPSATPSTSPSPSPSITPSPTPDVSPSPSPSVTPSPTPDVSPSPSASPSPTPPVTPTATPSTEPSATPAPSVPDNGPGMEPTEESTPSYSPTPAPTPAPSPTSSQLVPLD